ncbi:2,3-diaminopropionate biosynthesis protein SbnA [Lysinibacillus xylanilyticus]|uniref:2,3-diaminopropionate biosynthesis protein SbnA n=1 Tax=Lysinibacillus xylanilyticus TaxID=582475 RepID=UPI003800EAC7
MLNKLKELELYIGNTPVVKLQNEEINLFAKLEYYNLMNNIKARTAYSILKGAILRGEINENSTLIESSSGNLAISLAIMCKKINIKFIPVIDPNINKSYENILNAISYKVVKVNERDESGGFLNTRLNKVQELCSEISHSYWTNQYGNRDNFLAHYQGTGEELNEHFDDIDYAFIGVGTGGTISGVSQKLKEKFPNVKIIAVDSIGSLIFSDIPKKRYLPGIGSSIKPVSLNQKYIDEVVLISETNAIEGCHELFNTHAIFAGASSGSVFYALREYFKDKDLLKKPNVVFICPDNGMSYTDTVYNLEWVKWFKDINEHEEGKVLNKLGSS